MTWRVRAYLGLLAVLEESLLTGLLGLLVGGEVLGVRDLVNLGLVQTSQVDLQGGSNDVSGVDTAQGNTVDLEGAGNQQNTLVKSLQQDDALATEAAGQQDQDSAGNQRLTGSPGADSLADLLRTYSSVFPQFRVFVELTRLMRLSNPDWLRFLISGRDERSVAFWVQKSGNREMSSGSEFVCRRSVKMSCSHSSLKILSAAKTRFDFLGLGGVIWLFE